MNERNDFGGSVAVVTGGSSPIGQTLVRRLADAGAAVLATGRNETALAEATAGLERAAWLAADATDAAGMAAVRTAAEDRFGAVDLLVTVAGGGGRPTPFADLAPDEWRATVERNLTSTYLALHELLPGMAERGRGAAVTISSDAGRRVSQASVAYSVAKAGVLALTRQVAAEYAARGVRVNSVAPGAIRTPLLERAGSEVIAQIAAQHPSGRIGTPDDVADAVLYLLGAGSDWITGQTLDLGARVLT